MSKYFRCMFLFFPLFLFFKWFIFFQGKQASQTQKQKKWEREFEREMNILKKCDNLIHSRIYLFLVGACVCVNICWFGWHFFSLLVNPSSTEINEQNKQQKTTGYIRKHKTKKLLPFSLHPFIKMRIGISKHPIVFFLLVGWLVVFLHLV